MRRLLALIVYTFSLSAIGQNQELARVIELNKRSFDLLSIDRDSARFLSTESYHLNQDRFIDERAKNLLIVGMCLKYEGNIDSAYRFFQEAGRIAKERQMLRELGLSEWYIGKVWHHLKKFDKAIPYYLKAVETLEKGGELELKYKVLNGLGYIEKVRGNYSKSLSYLGESLAITEKYGFSNRNRMLQNISQVHAEMDDYDLAFQFNKQALNVSDTSVNKGLIIEALVGRAELYDKIEKPDSALFFFEKALRYCEEFEVSRSFVLDNLARHHHSIGDFERAITLLREQLDDILTPRPDLVLIKLSQGYAALEQLDSALVFATEAYQYSKERGIKKSACESAKLLSQLFAKMGKYEVSNEYLVAYSKCKDQIFNDEELMKLAEMRVKIETLQKEREIEELRANTNVIQLKRLLTLKLGVLIVVLLSLGFLMVYRQAKRKIKKYILKTATLENEVSRSKKDLHTQSLHMIRVNNSVMEIEEKLKQLKPKVNGHAMEVQRLINTIRVNKSQEKDWETFNQYYDGVNSGFADSLRERFPSLTLKEIRLCALLRMNLSNPEIASILNVAVRSCTMSKYRLKKKLELDEKDDLTAFVKNLDLSDSERQKVAS